MQTLTGNQLDYDNTSTIEKKSTFLVELEKYLIALYNS